MTTNDPLNPYPGNLKRHEVRVIESIGPADERGMCTVRHSDGSTVNVNRRNLIDMMHDDARDGLYEHPKREPMLSDEDIEKYPVHSPYDGGLEAIIRMPAKKVRDFYERLIDDGRLRVVEEVGIDEDGNCTKCGWDSDHRYPFSTCCPGCGNPIKR